MIAGMADQFAGPAGRARVATWFVLGGVAVVMASVFLPWYTISAANPCGHGVVTAAVSEISGGGWRYDLIGCAGLLMLTSAAGRRFRIASAFLSAVLLGLTLFWILNGGASLISSCPGLHTPPVTLPKGGRGYGAFIGGIAATCELVGALSRVRQGRATPPHMAVWPDR